MATTEKLNSSRVFVSVPPGLAYCRHLSTVRTHLSALVNHSIVPPEAAGGLSKEVWSKYQKDCKVGSTACRSVAPPPPLFESLLLPAVTLSRPSCFPLQNYKELELLRLVYYGGVQHDIRKEVWPFLLGHYKFSMGKKDMSQVRPDAVFLA